jgi:hypothetical protein
VAQDALLCRNPVRPPTDRFATQATRLVTKRLAPHFRGLSSTKGFETLARDKRNSEIPLYNFWGVDHG